MDRDKVVAFIKRCHFGYVATNEGDSGVSVRPVGINTIYDDNVYFFTFATTPKVSQIAANPNISVVWADTAALSQVRLKGKAYLETDPDVVERFKADNPMVAKLLPPGAEALFTLYRIEPELVQAAEGLVPYVTVDW